VRNSWQLWSGFTAAVTLPVVISNAANKVVVPCQWLSLVRRPILLGCIGCIGATRSAAQIRDFSSNVVAHDCGEVAFEGVTAIRVAISGCGGQELPRINSGIARSGT
jgi:hypothetical protein